VADIFHEVEEELRKDKYNELLRKWGPWALGAALAIVLGAAGWQGWAYLERQSAWSESDAYFAALDLIEAERYDDADLALQQLAEEASPGYAGLALMQRGELLLQNGDNAGAGYMFEQAADRFNVQSFADLARVKAAMALFDELSTDDLDNRLGETMQPERPYRLLAMEVVAAKAFDTGNLERARLEYDAIANDIDAVGRPVATRAQAALALIDRMEATNGGADEAAEAADDSASDPEPEFNLNAAGETDSDTAPDLTVDSPTLPDAASVLDTPTDDDGQD
jgi:hypothetical protein